MAFFRPSAGSKLGAFAFGSLLILSAPVTARAAGLFYQDLDGITVFALEGSAANPRIGVPGAEQAALRIREALEILRRRSPEYHQAIKALNGRVYIKYDPADRTLASPSGPLALFRTRTGTMEFDRAGTRSFVAVLGARVIRWPAADLAGIIVHELIGHGRQYAQNRLQAMDHRDRECEARLHQLRVYQDLGVTAGDSTMTAFRTSLEDVWCQRFARYLSGPWPGAYDLWTAAGVDTTRLIAAFDTYRRYAARTRRGGEGRRSTRPLDHVPGNPRQDEDSAAPSLRGAKSLIAYARLMLQNDNFLERR